MSPLNRAAAVILATLALGGCSGLWGHDEFDRYAQRSEKITLSAGDAKEVNVATHTLHPWPPEVGDRRIPADGAKTQRAIDRYRAGARPPDPLPPIGGQGGTLGGGGTVPAGPGGPAR